MQFRTEAEPLKGYVGMIDHHAPLLLIGSCFSDNIGEQLRADLFETSVNPFGPLYNPLSILNAVRILSGRKEVSTEDLIQNGGRFLHWDFHSRYSSTEREDASESLKKTVADASDVLRRASCVMVTFGTTQYYTLKNTGRVVANCHKMPADCFEKKTMPLTEVTHVMEEIVNELSHVNPIAKVIFTVSPLRYLSDGLHCNSIIKSTLLLAVDEVVKNHDNCIYFPALEILMDDLRDYRFYADDLKHPSSFAVKYIYDLFSKSFFNQETLIVASEGRRLTKRLGHKPFTSSETQDIKELDILIEHPELTAGFNRMKNEI